MDDPANKPDLFSSADEPPADPRTGSAGVVQTQSATVVEAGDVLRLAQGELPGPITVAYETYGRLNAQRDNAVLICHALSGDAHVAGRHAPDDPKAGWWDIMVGPGKGIDTERYFVICSNILGGCQGTTGPSTVNPATGRAWGLDFPVVTIEDMVKVQKLLLDRLGIARLLCAIGGSMGGQQVLEWTVRYPEAVRSAIPIATTARQGAQSIAFDAVGRNAILSDPHFARGRYHDGDPPARGLAIARMVGHITYLSEAGMHAKFGRQLRSREDYGYDFEPEFAVETYLDYQGKKFVQRFDANSYLYITKAMDYYDLGAAYGGLREAFEHSEASYLVLSFSSDWLFTPRQSRELVDAMIAAGRPVSYVNIDSPYGHDAFLLEPEVLGRLIGDFLRSVHDPTRPLPNGTGAAPGPARGSIYASRRLDYDRIEELIEADSRVLDLGCGNGELLERLIADKGVTALGVERDQESLCQCVHRGVPVIQRDLAEPLDCLADGSYDVAILSQTLQTLKRPEGVLREMLRVAGRCIVTFPNFGHWRCRAGVLLGGGAPVTDALPYPWHDSPNRSVLSIRDFRRFCERLGARIVAEIPLGGPSAGLARAWPNLLAPEALFVIARARRSLAPGRLQRRSGAATLPAS